MIKYIVLVSAIVLALLIRPVQELITDYQWQENTSVPTIYRLLVVWVSLLVVTAALVLIKRYRMFRVTVGCITVATLVLYTFGIASDSIGGGLAWMVSDVLSVILGVFLIVLLILEVVTTVGNRKNGSTSYKGQDRLG